MAKNFDWLRERLTEIACLDDALANQRLETTGSYSCFDEPGSVRIAREILVELERTPAQAVVTSEPIVWRDKMLSIVEIANYGAKKIAEIDPALVPAKIAGSNNVTKERFWLIARMAKEALAATPEPHAALREALEACRLLVSWEDRTTNDSLVATHDAAVAKARAALAQPSAPSDHHEAAS